MNQSTPIINHFVASFNLKDFDDNLEYLGRLGVELCEILNLKIVQETHYEYKPYGKTLVFIIATSHLSIHTWPENKYIHFDLLTCSEISLIEFEKALKNILIEQKILNLKYAKVASLN